MRKRLKFGLAGALIGGAIAPVVNGFLDLNSGVAFGICAVGGLLLGYLASIFTDVFSSSMEEAEARTRE